MKTMVLLGILSMGCVIGYADPVPVSGAVESVIVYRGQALVTRNLEIPAGGGDMELLVENLPEKILPESLYAQSDGSVSVLSVRYRENIVSEDSRDEVKALQQQIETLRRQIQNSEFDHQNVLDRIDRYREQWKLSVDSSNADLNRGILQPEAIQKMTGYLESKSVELHQAAVKLVNEKQDLEKQLAEAEKKFNELSQGRRKINRQALIYISSGGGLKTRIQLSYLVRDANWSPQYNMRADESNKKTGIEYNAVVFQSSGEDWTNAVLALSTAEPAMVSAPPALVSMQVTLGSGVPLNYQMNFSGLQQQTMNQAAAVQQGQVKQEVYADQNEYFNSLIRGKRDNIAKGINAQRELNTIAISNQMIELEADRKMLEQLRDQVAVVARTEGISVLYSLKGKLSLPSRNEQQILSIASFDCPADFVFVASPLLTDYVYLQGDITNSSDTILLPGPASMFRNGSFVGRSSMKLVTSGQKFSAGFGIDSQIQVVREFSDKKSETLLGSRYNEQHYRIALSNYKSTPVSLRLLDRMPWTENASLSIELKNSSHPLSEDAEYLRIEKPKGLLRWDLTLDPKTTDTHATIVTYSYAMKYDKTLSVVTTQTAQQSQ